MVNRSEKTLDCAVEAATEEVGYLRVHQSRLKVLKLLLCIQCIYTGL